MATGQVRDKIACPFCCLHFEQYSQPGCGGGGKCAAALSGAQSPRLPNTVRIIGLIVQADLNGRTGNATTFDPVRRRYGVILKQARTTVWVRPNNLAQVPIEEAFAGAASFAGPAAECVHGGPDPSKFPAMMQVVGELEGKTAHARNRVNMQARASGQLYADHAAVQTDVDRAQLDAITSYLSRPDVARAVTPETYKILFSCGVDAVIDSDFASGRSYVQQGAIVREVVRLGKATFMSEYKKGADLSGGQLIEMHRTRRTIATDRGLVLFLVKETDCACLAVQADAVAVAATPSTRMCSWCNVERLKADTRTCSACRTCSYCNTNCQQLHWRNGHKAVCKAVAK